MHAKHTSQQLVSRYMSALRDSNFQIQVQRLILPN